MQDERKIPDTALMPKEKDSPPPPPPPAQVKHTSKRTEKKRMLQDEKEDPRLGHCHDLKQQLSSSVD